jgi:hypothetical protein
MTKHLIDHLETEVNWDKFFSIVDSLYGDKGFSTNADNFTRVIALEKALDACSELERVDQKGYDFLYGGRKVELKVAEQLFYKGGYSKTLGRNTSIHETKDFKVKSFLSENRTVENFREETTFDWLMVIDLGARRVALVTDEKARNLYRSGSDGAIMRLKLGDYYECEIPPVNSYGREISLSQELNKTIENFIFTF